MTSLVRLRDTIASEAKIQAWTTSYGEQEKLLRNLRIEQIRMERNNADNRFRVELRLLQHRIRLQEQELEHIQQQITSAQATVDNVWHDVVKKGRPHSEPQNAESQFLARNAGISLQSALGRIDKELASVLGRFEAYLAKLHQKHSITVKAANVLATPWQRQVEEYRVRMVIRIQRAYRARKRAREIKLDARDKLKEQIRERELKLRNEQLEKQRLQSLQAKDLERHQMRMRAKQEQEAKLKAEQEARQKVIVDRVREHEVAQMQLERNKHAISRMWSNWRQFLGRRRQKRKANAMFLKFTLLKWKRHFAAFKKADSAAKALQRFVRHRQERAKFLKEMRHQAKRNALARKYLQKAQRRVVVRLFNHWVVHVQQQQTLRANFAEIIQKRESFWLKRWSEFVCEQRAAKDAAARLVQRLYRGRLARRLFQYCRHRNNQALAIQRVYRGHRSRIVTAKLRQIKAHQYERATRIRTRIHHRSMGMCLWGLRRHAYIELYIKAIENRRQDTIKRDGLFAFSLNATDEKEARADLERLRHESAKRIQRQFRRHLCQRVFREQIRLYRTARSIQRVFRGYRIQQAVKKLRWQIDSATRIQTVWRRYRARQYVTSLRIERILAAAFRGDYAVIKRAIAGGYWYAADAEGNGILHTAAAAGHKRIVKLCLRCSFDIDAANAQQQTPLHLVLANLPPSFHLLPGAVDLDTNDPDVRARADRLALAEYMIDHGAWHEAPDMHGLTPLLLSASLGHADAVEMLLDRGANTEARTIVGQLNAVQLAVEGNHHETLRVLLESRAFDPAPSLSPVASETDYDAEVYADPPPTWLQLHACAGRGLLNCLRVLLDHIQPRPAQFPRGIIDRRDREGYTPLIYAVSTKSTDAVQLLLERGAGPDVKDYFGRAPLHFTLQASSADKEGSGDGITTPTSGMKAREEIVRLLTMFDADVNVKDTDGDVPLHMSYQSDALIGCSSLLLTNGAVLAANAIGNHPTHVAAQCGAIATLRLLLDYGGDMNLKNYAGKTPLVVARMHGQVAVAEFVREYFAQEAIEAVDDDKREDEGDNDVGGTDEGVRTKEDRRLNDEPLEETDGFDDDEEAGALQERTPEQWASALATAFRMDTLAEWMMFMDEATGVPFYVNFKASDGGVVCTWEPSVEFDAALASDWEVVRCPPGWTPPVAPSVEHHDHDHRCGALVADSPASSVSRSATEWKYLYHHRVTGELRAQVPPVDLALLQDVVQRSKRHQMLLRARVCRTQTNSGDGGDVSASAVEYLRFSHAFATESAQARAEHLAAVSIQRKFRARRTLRLVRLLLLQNRRAVDLQRAFRSRRARLQASALDHWRSSATKIQAAWRGFSTRRREQVGGLKHAERVRFRHRLRAAKTIQRVFREFVGRCKALLEALHRQILLRRFISSSLQPPKNVTDWQKLCTRSRKRRSFMVWDEFRAPSELLYLPFYCHHVTRVCSWEQSAPWLQHDLLAFMARKQLWAWGYTDATVRAAHTLQRLWHVRVARIALRAVLSAVRLMRRCERAYLEEPTSLVALGNYALFLHAVAHDYERARPLFTRLLRAMVQRGPDVPFVLFAYAIFAYITQEVDAREVSEFVVRAKARDPKIASFQVALLGFFRPQVLVNPQSCEANLNYAACLQWLVVSDVNELSQLESAQEYYMRALAADPRRRGTMELLQDVLDRKRAIIRKQRPPRRRQDRRSAEDEDNGAEFDGHEVFRRWQAAQAAREDQERTRALLEQQELDARRAAAIKIQARYRRRRAQRQAYRLQQELRRAAAHAEQAKERAVHDAVSRAFDLVGAATSGKGKAKAAQTLSLPVKQLEAVFTALVGGLKRSDGGEDASTAEEVDDSEDLAPADLAATFTRLIAAPST